MASAVKARVAVKGEVEMAAVTALAVGAGRDGGGSSTEMACISSTQARRGERYWAWAAREARADA